jgi:hypothetical protein
LPFACTHCENTEVLFATRTELKIHKKEHHPEVKKIEEVKNQNPDDSLKK